MSSHSGAASPPFAREIEQTQLANGLRVISEYMPHVRSVSVGLWINSGSRREEGPESGISHFIEHMVFKGTETRSAEEIAREMDGLGGHLDAFTGKELVSFNAKVLDEHLPAAFEVLADMVLHPVFRDDDIEKEKGVILEELKMEVDNPEYLLHESFLSNFWKGHPLGQSILGTRETINGFTRDMIGDYWRRIYTPANIIITAAGHVHHEQIVALAQRYFDSLAPGPVLETQPPPKPLAPVLTKRKNSLEQVHLMIGVPSYPAAHPNRFAAYTMNTLLGGTMSSRLFQNIREQRGLVYSVGSEASSYKDSGYLSVYAGTSRASLDEVIMLVLEEFRKFKNELVGEEELRRAKNHLKGSLMLSLESTSSRMTNLARQQIYFGRFPTLDELLEHIEGVTSEQMRDVANEFFQPSRIGLAVLGPLTGVKIKRTQLVC
ncbi:MAG: insulinase family protein [Bryobacterales bacterium]|nr:insulinase family protein [Bryobacterales bacterium]